MPFTPEELAEMAAADAEIEASFHLEQSDLERSRDLDRTARFAHLSGAPAGGIWCAVDCRLASLMKPPLLSRWDRGGGLSFPAYSGTAFSPLRKISGGKHLRRSAKKPVRSPDRGRTGFLFCLFREGNQPF